MDARFSKYFRVLNMSFGERNGRRSSGCTNDNDVQYSNSRCPIFISLKALHEQDRTIVSHVNISGSRNTASASVSMSTGRAVNSTFHYNDIHLTWTSGEASHNDLSQNTNTKATAFNYQMTKVANIS